MSKQFNARLDDDVVEWIAGESIRRTAELGAKVSQADVIAILVRREIANPSADTVLPRKLSKKQQAALEREQADITAQVVEREDIDYSDTDSLPHTHVVHHPIAKHGIAAVRLPSHRLSLSPLLKPKDKRR